jgi:hypothetical protein
MGSTKRTAKPAGDQDAIQRIADAVGFRMISPGPLTTMRLVVASFIAIRVRRCTSPACRVTRSRRIGMSE